jgi:hypothetical protein
MASIQLPPTSKKLVVWALTSAALTYLLVTGKITAEQYAVLMGGTGVGYQLGQGMADNGKEKAKVEKTTKPS